MCETRQALETLAATQTNHQQAECSMTFTRFVFEQHKMKFIAWVSCIHLQALAYLKEQQTISHCQ